jgi:hypothetical protein
VVVDASQPQITKALEPIAEEIQTSIMSTHNESEKRMEALQKQMLALTEMFVASQSLKLQSETAPEAEVATAAKIRQHFGGHRPSDLHSWFRSHLENVAVSKRGESRFAKARYCWDRLVERYQPSPEVQPDLMGYAFTEDAAEVYQDVLKEVPNDADSDQIWGAMQMKICNPDQIQFQRDQFSAASLEEHETVADLSKRLYKLVCGLPECQSQEIKDIILKQRLNDALPRELQTAYATIRHTHSYDMAASVLSTVQRTKGIVGRSKRREQVRAMTDADGEVATLQNALASATAEIVCTSSAGRPPTFTSWWWRTASWRHAELSGSGAS